VPAASDGAAVSLRIFDLKGSLVRTLIDQSYPAGPAIATWDGLADDGRAMPSGTYMYRVRIGQHVEARSLTLVR
jgi:flagellar hook assembly protein FlgD